MTLSFRGSVIYVSCNYRTAARLRERSRNELDGATKGMDGKKNVTKT